MVRCEIYFLSLTVAYREHVLLRDILKLKFAYKMAKQNQGYLMIFGGSSVTAGHDSYYNQR